MFRECALPEWLRMSHMSVLGVCWVQDYFDERPNFGARAIAGKKEACRKMRKRSMQEEKPRVRRKTSLTILGLDFLIRIVMVISLKNSINNNLGGLGQGLVG
jgi:hypothetical protein